MSLVTFIDYCKKFVDFQIDLSIKRESFPLRTIDCRYSWARRDADFDYDDNFLEIYYDSDDNHSDSDSNSDKQTNCFASCVCYTVIRTNLVFERYFQTSKNAFLMYFAKKLHVNSNTFFSV